MKSWTEGPSEYPELDGPCCIAVVNLARLVDAPILLPSALLACCGLGASVFEGYKREDGTREYLSTEDLGRCFDASAKVVQQNAKIALLVLAPEASPACKKHRVSCERVIGRTLALLHRSIDELGCFKLFSPFAHVHMNLCAAVCDPCLDMIEERDVKQREDLWKILPSLFNITVEGWEANNPQSALVSNGIPSIRSLIDVLIQCSY